MDRYSPALSFMGSFWPILTIFIATLLHSSTSQKESIIKLSTISAAPAVLPGPPVSETPSPALSPDMYPQFPSPAKDPALPPGDSSLPTIPSSPSPPNPDDIIAPGPTGTAFAPMGSGLRDSSSPASFTPLGVLFVSLLVQIF